ncbi:hypothetical protein AB0942_07090 [Streptomyces nodosus]|uniref:hypothetical protein n=1 Tax=Streptomyces nodosus TaxID=40318 RepID=UPI0034563263
MNLRVVLDPYWRTVVDSEEGVDIAIRAYERVDTFAEALRACGIQAVQVDYLDEIPALGAEFFLCEASMISKISEKWAAPPRSIARRVVLLNADRGPAAPREVEFLGSVGAIERRQYEAWRSDGAEVGGARIFGLKRIAIEIGASWGSPALWETENYCLMWHRAYSLLPELLAVYLLEFGKSC